MISGLYRPLIFFCRNLCIPTKQMNADWRVMHFRQKWRKI